MRRAAHPRGVLLLAGCLTAFLLLAASALAAAPEPPEVSVAQPIQTTEATFLGILSPNASEPNKGGIYRFLYNTGGKCEGGKATEPGLSLGAAHEELPAEPVTGLTPGTKYTVCLSITNLHSETTLSAPVPFTTPTVPQAPVTSSPAKSITARTAILEGTLNPTAAAEDGWHFLYSTEPTCTENTAETPAVAVAPVAAKTKVHVEVTELQPHHRYEFCLVATNEAGETAQSANEVSFETKAAAPTVESESTSAVSSTTATIEAQINPNNEKTSGYMLYSSSPAVEETGALKTPTELLPAPSELGEGYGAQPVSQTLAALPAGATFYYQAAATNPTGTTYGPVQSFTTVPVPTTTEASAVTATSATFNGSVSPLSETVETGYYFNYRAGGECDGEASTTPGNAETGSATKSVSTEVTGLSPNTNYTVCLVASNVSGSEQAAAVSFTTPAAAPVIESEGSANVDSSEARLEARIDPENSPASYHFEYGTAAGSYGHSVPVPDGQIPAKLSGVSVEDVLTGLKAETTYHYRVVASNALPGTTAGEDETFTTTAAPAGPETPGSCPNEKPREEQPYGLGAPGCRAYELVSPANTYGQDATRETEAPPRASESKEGEPALAYGSQGAFGQPKGAQEESKYISRRTPAGWTNQAVTPLATPNQGREAITTDYPGNLFNPELTAGIALSSAKLTEDAEPEQELAEQNVYRFTFAPEAFQWLGKAERAGSYVYGASEDLSRVLLNDPSHPGSVIESTGGEDLPVAVTNAEEPVRAQVGAQIGAGTAQPFNKDAWHAISTDGKRVDFTSNGQLYARVNIGAQQSPLAEAEATGTGTLTEGSTTVTSLAASAGTFAGGQALQGNGIEPGTTVIAASAETLTLSRPAAASGSTVELTAGGHCTLATDACTIELSASRRFLHANDAGPQPARFWGASENGEKVFFTSDAELTEDADTDVSDPSPSLYEYNLTTGGLKDLSVNPEHSEYALVEGVAQISEDGSYVYFAADGDLAGGASAGQPNLYVTHDGGPPTFIATLAGYDSTDWNVTGEPETGSHAQHEAGPAINTAAVNPAGTELAFISEQQLTGYDSEQAEPGECEARLRAAETHESGSCREIFLYNAVAKSLVCASCNPSGARPAGSAVLPTAWEPLTSYRPRTLLADGSLFFDSRDALTGAAPTGHQTVYEYKEGTLRAVSPTGLNSETFFLDATPEGSDVFFASAARITAEAPGGNIAVWDARVDGGFPGASAPPQCASAEACQPPGAGPAPSASVPPSATFSGPGNPVPSPGAPAAAKAKPKPQSRAQKLAAALKICRRDRAKRKRGACEKQARRRYGPVKHARRAGVERGVRR